MYDWVFVWKGIFRTSRTVEHWFSYLGKILKLSNLKKGLNTKEEIVIIYFAEVSYLTFLFPGTVNITHTCCV